MTVKEIRELEDEVREVDISGNRESGIGNKEGNRVDWEERDVETEDSGDEEEDKKEDFSIGDTMLARGEAVESWGGGGLEEELEGEEFERGFGVEDFDDEEDDFGEESFSYETMGQNGSGDLYGAAVGLYNTSGNQGGESSMYNVAGPAGKKSSMGSVYQVEGGRQKKFREGGKRKRSELEGFVAKKGRRKGVSMM